MTKTQDLRPKTGVSAILLAAGQSRRMGAFKPLLPFGKSTVIQSCIKNLLDGGVAEIIVSKHRNGPTGVTRLAFLDHFVKFANMARE